MVAAGIGGRTVAELINGPAVNDEGMEIDEFLTWAAFFSLEPPHVQRADVHVAMLLAQQFNLNRGDGQSAKRPQDFMPRWHDEDEQVMDLDELELAMKMHIAAMGGDVEGLVS